jgi:hypothetical protein
VVEAHPRSPSSRTITTTVGGGWFLTTGLYATTYDLQLYPILPLSSPKLTLLRWGGRGAPPDPPRAIQSQPLRSTNSKRHRDNFLFFYSNIKPFFSSFSRLFCCAFAGHSGIARAVGLARISVILEGHSRMARFYCPLNLYGPLTAMDPNTSTIRDVNGSLQRTVCLLPHHNDCFFLHHLTSHREVADCAPSLQFKLSTCHVPTSNSALRKRPLHSPPTAHSCGN